MQLARQPAGGADQGRSRRREAIDGAEHLRIARLCIRGCRRRERVDAELPAAREIGGARRPGRRRLPARELALQGLQPCTRIGDDRLRAVLRRIERGEVELDKPPRGVAKQRAAAAGEILQSRADGEHDIGVLGQGIGGGGARHADRTHGVGMIPRQGAFPGLRFGNGNSRRAHEGIEPGGRPAVVDAATRDHQGRTRGAQDIGGGFEFERVRPLASDAMDMPGEEAIGIVAGLGLNVLTEAESHRPAIHRIEQNSERGRQRRKELLGSRDAIPIARHRAEAIIRGHGRVAEILDLLQDRIGTPIGENVAGQQQHRQAVHMRQRRRGHHVGGARADRRRACHEAAPVRSLREGDRRQRHRLLVMGAMRGQGVARRIERLAEPGHVAVTEDRPHARAERDFVTVDLDELRREPSNQRLRRGESHRDLPGFRVRDAKP